MAKPPVAAAAEDQDDDAGAAGGASMDDQGGADDAGAGDQGDEGDNNENVLFTVMAEPDGSFRLIQGDEDEDDETGGDTGSEAEDQGTGTTDEGQGKVYHTKGELLKAILDMLNEHETTASGAGSDEDNFQSGFTGSDAGAAAPGGAAGGAPMAQKY